MNPVTRGAGAITVGRESLYPGVRNEMEAGAATPWQQAMQAPQE
jgi:hypothetical protein